MAHLRSLFAEPILHFDRTQSPPQRDGFHNRGGQWYPELVEDNRFIEATYGPAEGYHLSKDLADHAIGMIRDEKASNPSKPWFMWFCPGANHAPHQAPQEYTRHLRSGDAQGI